MTTEPREHTPPTDAQIEVVKESGFKLDPQAQVSADELDDILKLDGLQPRQEDVEFFTSQGLTFYTGDAFAAYALGNLIGNLVELVAVEDRGDMRIAKSCIHELGFKSNWRLIGQGAVSPMVVVPALDSYKELLPGRVVVGRDGFSHHFGFDFANGPFHPSVVIRIARPAHATDQTVGGQELAGVGAGKASSAFGVYAFLAYCRYVENDSVSAEHWSAIKARMQSLLTGNYGFDEARKNHRKDEAEKLNGDIAGLIGMARLARLRRDSAPQKQAIERLTSLLEMRLNLERENPKILEVTESSTKNLHISKLARFCPMTREGVRPCANSRMDAEQRIEKLPRSAERLASRSRRTNDRRRELHEPTSFLESVIRRRGVG